MTDRLLTSLHLDNFITQHRELLRLVLNNNNNTGADMMMAATHTRKISLACKAKQSAQLEVDRAQRACELFAANHNNKQANDSRQICQWAALHGNCNSAQWPASLSSSCSHCLRFFITTSCNPTRTNERPLLDDKQPPHGEPFWVKTRATLGPRSPIGVLEWWWQFGLALVGCPAT